MTTTEPIRAALADCIEATDNISPSEDIGIFDGSGRWISLITVGDLRALAATPPAPSAEMRERIKAVLIKVRDELIPIMDDMSEEEITEALVDAILSSGLVAPARDDWNEAIEAAAKCLTDLAGALEEGGAAYNKPQIEALRERANTISSLHRGAKESDGTAGKADPQCSAQRRSEDTSAKGAGVAPGPSDPTQETVTR